MSRQTPYALFLTVLVSLLLPSKASPFVWVEKADTLELRGLHGGGTINNLIYLAGGGYQSTGGCSSLDSGEVYDPVTDQWSPIAAMTFPRTKPSSAVATFGGAPRLYIIGGFEMGWDCFNDNFMHGNIDEYDPVAGTWRLVGDCSAPPDDCLPDAGYAWGTCAVAVDNRIYIMGGTDDMLSRLSARLAAYDPDSDTFERLADMPAAVSDGSCAAVGRTIYWFGGWDQQYAVHLTRDVYAYDIDADSWSDTAAPMPTARADAAAVAIDGIIYVIGGWDGTGTYSGMYNSVDAYDPALDQWTADVPEPLGCIEDSPAFGVRGRAGFTLHLANDGVEDQLFACGGTIGVSTPTKCNESTGVTVVEDHDPPVFGGLTGASELTDCPDPDQPLVRLTWEAGTDATPPVTYNVYRGTTPGFPADGTSLIASGLDGVEYTDALTAADCGLTYFYLVRAQDSAVPPNEDSNDVRLAVDITCPPPPVPASINNRLFVHKDPAGDPVLDWSDYTPSGDVTHYNVYRSLRKDLLGNLLYEPVDQTQVDTLATGDQYFYDVRAANDCLNGESED